MMPKVNLGKNAKKAAKELTANKVLSEQILLSDLNYTQIAEATGLHRTTISAVARDPTMVSGLSLEHVREIADVLGLNRTQWLQLGGFDK